MLNWLLFAACAAVILIAGVNLSRAGDIIAEQTGLGRTWIGVALIATVTSLPELITGISAVRLVGAPDIAVGDVLGSCLFNLLIIALLDLIGGPTPLSLRVHQGHILAAAFGILGLSLVSLGLAGGAGLPTIGWFSSLSLLLLALYLLAMRLVFAYERKRIAAYVTDLVEERRYDDISRRRAVGMYALNAALIVVAATALPHLGKAIAVQTGLGQTVVGSVLIAIATSLPEVVVSAAALRIGAVDLAVGNLFGSNLFNLAILGIDDLFYTGGPLLAAVSPTHLFAAQGAILLTAIAVIGLVFSVGRKVLPLAWDALAIGVAYVLVIALLYGAQP